MSKIFISYRRDDSAGYAHAIYRELVQHFSKDRLFMDVDTVEPERGSVFFVKILSIDSIRESLHRDRPIEVKCNWQLGCSSR